jgi:hypothetical protein
VLSIFLLALANATGSAATQPVYLRAAGEGNGCMLTINGELVADGALPNLVQTRRKTAVLDIDPHASHRCVAGAIARLKRAGFKVLEVSKNGVPVTVP